MKKTKVNNQIRFPEVQVIDQKGESVGRMTSQKALKKAQTQNLDLVLVAEKAQPPVVRIMDHGKYLYSQKKKEQKSKKAGEMKEMRLSLNIDEHDRNFKIKQAEKFLKKGHPLKISLMLHGRQQAFSDRAVKVIEEAIKELDTVAQVEQPVKREGKVFNAILKPR